MYQPSFGLTIDGKQGCCTSLPTQEREIKEVSLSDFPVSSSSFTSLSLLKLALKLQPGGFDHGAFFDHMKIKL